MKTLFQIITSLIFVTPYLVSAQSGLDAALNKGSAEDAGAFFAARLDVSIPGSEGTMSSADAVQALKDFFSANQVKGYNRAHLTAPQNGRAAYSLGDLYTANGTFRLYLYFDSEKKISEIRIQK